MKQPSGDQLLLVFEALANPHRMRVLGLLQDRGRNYVSEMAREVGISRPLLHMHLKKLEQAGLVKSQMELSSDGKAHNYYDVVEFDLHLTPVGLAQAAAALSPGKPKTP